MIPLYFSLGALSCLGFTGAVPFHTAREPLHLPLVAKRGPIPAEGFIIAADDLRGKYGYRQASHSKRQSIPVTEEPNGDHLVEIQIGTEFQQFRVVPDTGSVDLWIDSADFDRGASSTFSVVGGPATITYRSGSVTGDVAEDIVQFGSFEATPQRFLLGTTITTPPVDPNNGNLGLPAPDATSPLSPFGAQPFWANVRANDPTVDSRMSFKFPPAPGGSRQTRSEHHEDSGGVLTIGGVNDTLFTGDVEFLPLFSFGGLCTHWALPVLGITVGGENVALPPGGVASFDTSTPLIGGPTDAVAAVYAKIPGSRPLDGEFTGFYGFPCGSVIKIYICFGGKFWPIEPQEMDLGPITGDSSTCVGAIFDLKASAKRNEDKPDWIIGVAFLRNVYSVFRSDPSAFGLAQLA
jgi:cathepsin D